MQHAWGMAFFPLYLGAKIVLAGASTPDQQADLIKKESVTWLNMVPTQLHMLLDTGKFGNVKVLTGGSPFISGLAWRAAEAGVKYGLIYGGSDQLGTAISVVPEGVPQDTKEALEAFKKQDYQSAFKLYKESADANNTTAQNALSYLYFNGLGVEKNKEKGIFWLVKAAKNEDTRAQNDLGMMYLTGQNVKQDSNSAFTWLSKASDANNSNAQYNLALMYYRGDGVDENATKAVELLDAAAVQGNEQAIRNVGIVYMQLLKFDKAAFWLEKNALNGDENACYLLAEIYCEKEEFKKAKLWAQKAKESGNENIELLWMKYNLEKY